MLQKVKITRLSKTQQETQYGLKDKVIIQTEQYGEKWISCFMNKSNERSLGALKEGMITELMIDKKGDFLNFRPVSEMDKLTLRVDKLESIAGIGVEDAPVQEAPPEVAQEAPADDGF